MTTNGIHYDNTPRLIQVMKPSTLSLVILLFALQISYSQPSSSGLSPENSKYKNPVPNGIYTSLQSMNDEKPLLQYQIKYKKAPDSSDHWVTTSQFKIQPKLKNGEQLIFGFSDGVDFYINSRLYDNPQTIFRYSKLVYKGKKYGIFIAVIGLALPHQKYPAFIDLETGNILPVQKVTVMDLIRSDKQLLHEFTNEATNKQDYISFLIRYDQKL